MTLFREANPDDDFDARSEMVVPITFAEYRRCHPKCGECAFWIYEDGECGNGESNCFGYEMNPTTDYCSHYEPK